MIKYVVDEDYIKEQAADMASQIRHHGIEHAKLLIEESFKYPFTDEQRKQAVDSFLLNFSEEINEQVLDLKKSVNGYLNNRIMVEVSK